MLGPLSAHAAQPRQVIADGDLPARQAAVCGIEQAEQPDEWRLTPSSTTATTPKAVMLGGPCAWTREPIHRARSGPPVQTLMVVSAIPTTRPSRLTRVASDTE